jgi:hypothetical protein
LASLVVHSSDEEISLRALKQIHRLTTIDLYRQSLGDALSDAINNYIYLNYKNVPLIENFLSNSGIEILFYDYIEASCELPASRMIKQITIGHWKKQPMKTIEFVLKQISQKIRNQQIEPKSSSRFVSELKQILNLTYSNENDENDDEKRNFDLIVNVLTKIYFVFGQKPFIDRSLNDPLFLFVYQNWFEKIIDNQNDIPFLLDGWSKILTQWFSNRRKYLEQLK